MEARDASNPGANEAQKQGSDFTHLFSPLALARDTRNTRPSTGWCCPLDSLLTTRILIAVGTRHGFPRPSDLVLGKAFLGGLLSLEGLEDPKTPEPGMKPSV